MKYLTIMPDYTGSCLWDNFAGNIALNSLQLSDDFINRLNAWHSAYKTIIPLDEAQRKAMFLEIDRLDQEGLLLTQELKRCLAEVVKIRYYSEGRGVFLGT